MHHGRRRHTGAERLRVDRGKQIAVRVHGLHGAKSGSVLHEMQARRVRESVESSPAGKPSGHTAIQGVRELGLLTGAIANAGAPPTSSQG